MTSSTTPAAPIAIHSHETYLSQGIPSASALDPSPISQFSAWFAAASKDPSVIEPEAMSVSTVSSTGIPSTRVVLLKRVDETGWVFFTNYDSRKGRELFPNGVDGGPGGYASIAFYWRPLHLSVRIVGRAEKVSAEETKEYYDSRPVGSRIGAWASQQSTPLSGREELEEAVKEVERKYGVQEGSSTASGVDVGPAGTAATDGDKEIPVPPFWGGVRIVPFEVEFWAGRPSRLHDRFRYTRAEGSGGEWEITRLAP